MARWKLVGIKGTEEELCSTSYDDALKEALDILGYTVEEEDNG